MWLEVENTRNEGLRAIAVP